MPPPGARRSSQGQRSGDDEGGRPDQNDGFDTMLRLRRGRESELSNCIERGPLGIYRVQEETPNPRQKYNDYNTLNNYNLPAS